MRLKRELSEARNKLANLHSLNETGNDPPGMDDMLAKSQHYVSLRQNVDKLDAELGTSDLAPGHFKYTRMVAMRNSYAAKLDDAREEVKQSLFASLAAESEADVGSASKMLDDVRAQIETVSREVSRSVSDRADLAALEAEEEGLTRQLEKANEDLSKLNAVASTTEFANIEWARYPQTPDMPSFPKLGITLSVAILLGLALSLGIAFFRELTDNTVRTPQDLARVGNMNLLGMIPHEDDDPQAAGARLPLVIFDAPQSMLAESFRQVRSRLQHAASLETTRSMLVTSAGPGDGKTTVAVNLAAGLALNGRRILLVDANFRRPQMHNVFDTTNEYGFADVLNSLDAFEQCVQATAVPNLSVLTSGAKPLNPTELLESQLLIDFIERALEDYDHVIFDSGPLLLASETMALAPRVDGVVTVCRARANSRGVLQRMRDMLRQVKAEHLGVVLNAVRSQGGGYYGSNIKAYYAYQNG
jgi:capsular exopolysaccharide synthesis family protein